MKYISSVEEVAPKYSTFLLDMWGVMHDGSKPYTGVLDTVRNLKKLQRSNPDSKMIILSNSSKRKGNAIKTLTKLGFDPLNDFADIITSGEVSYRMLSGDATLQCETWDVISKILNDKEGTKNAFVYGSGDGDEDYISSCGWTVTHNLENADLIIARGTFTIHTTSENENVVVSKHTDEKAYEEELERTLQEAAKLRIPMLVTNPDKVRPDVGLPPMPGAIGDRYIELLRNNDDDVDCEKLVRRIGKPYPEVYTLALKGNEDPMNTAIMVGDALETDVTGGTAANCATLWVVMDGIHSPAVREMMDVDDGCFEEKAKVVLDEFNEKRGYQNGDKLRPSFVTKNFRW